MSLAADGAGHDTVDVLVTGGAVMTMDPARRVLADGWVAVSGGVVVEIGTAAQVPPTARRVVDAAGSVVLPGFVNAHAHSLDILLRGGVSDDRRLYDWLINVVLPAMRHCTLADDRTAVRLYALEALRSGVTTVVDQIETPFARWDEIADAVVDAWAGTGMRAVVAQMFYDAEAPELAPYLAAMEAKEPDVAHDLGAEPGRLDDMLAAIDGMIRRHHGREDGRISFWPAPGVALLCTAEALRGAQALAREHGVMVTTHVAESPVDARQHGMTSVEYLASVGYLDDRALLGHCVQLSTGDLRILAASGAHVSTQSASNAFLGNGVARVAEMHAAGVTVGLGTDDACCNNGVNLLRDLRVVALMQKAHYRDPAAITAERVLEMATIDGARAVGMADTIGSIEVGKRADLVVVDMTGSHLWPRQSLASALVHQARGDEVRTVLVDGHVVLDEGRPVWLSADEERALVEAAQEASDRIRAAGALPARSDAEWVSRRTV